VELVVLGVESQSDFGARRCCSHKESSRLDFAWQSIVLAPEPEKIIRSTDEKEANMPHIKRFAIALSTALLVASASAATCPIEECDYGDAKYKADFAKWLDCANEHANRLNHTMDVLAVMYPKFGIAWRAFSDEQKAAINSDGKLDFEAVKEAKRRFEDRILSTAEPEALEDYNMFMLAEKQHPVESQCGAIREPPKIHP
jgi:hypothetical protein